MSSRLNMLKRKEELEREIERLESHMQSQLSGLKNQAVQGVQPSTVIKRYPLQSLGAFALVGVTTVLLFKAAGSKRAIDRKHKSALHKESSSTEAEALHSAGDKSFTPVNRVPSLLSTVRSELQRMIVHQVVSGVSRYLDTTLKDAQSRQSQQTGSDTGEGSESKM